MAVYMYMLLFTNTLVHLFFLILILWFCVFPFQNDLRFGVEQDVDVVFASFIRKAKDIEDIKKELGEKGKHIWIISKVRSS